MKKKENLFQSLTIKIDVPPITVEVPTVTVTARVPTIKELLENKILWRIVIYSSLVEFYGKIKLMKFFEAHGVEQKAWHEKLERLSLGQVRHTLKGLQLIDNDTSKQMARIAEVRNEVVHNLLVSSILVDESVAEEVSKYAKQCISKLAKT